MVTEEGQVLSSSAVGKRGEDFLSGFHGRTSVAAALVRHEGTARPILEL